MVVKLIVAALDDEMRRRLEPTEPSHTKITKTDVFLAKHVPIGDLPGSVGIPPAPVPHVPTEVRLAQSAIPVLLHPTETECSQFEPAYHTLGLQE